MKGLKNILVLCTIITFTFTGCNDNFNKVIKKIESPNGKYTAYYFIRDLGATTKASYQLSVFPKDSKFNNESGNIFIIYGEFDVEWQSDRTIMVTIKSDGEILKKQTNYDGININYS